MSARNGEERSEINDDLPSVELPHAATDVSKSSCASIRSRFRCSMSARNGEERSGTNDDSSVPSLQPAAAVLAAAGVRPSRWSLAAAAVLGDAAAAVGGSE